MNNEDRKQIQTIIRETQMRINQIVPGYRILLIEAERSEQEIRADVTQALQDRQNEGMSASNYNFPEAPSTLDRFASREERELIERALQESSGIEVEK